ncbi:hypothetical protein AWR38_17760 [Idiomarina sp. WRN-38]|nr:hypothetical protein AUR68_17740 [Idiomarina sp. H105]OAE97138.1 hypothetical protein AWR38_17760 [Idiomarina sp. WRN-38]
MASVTFPTEYGGSGITITDDADPQTGLDGTGYITRFVPALQQGLAMTGHAVLKAGEADSSAQTATNAAQQASDDRDSINLDLQTLNGLVSDADASAVAAAGSATTASNMADAVAQATATYTSVSAGLSDTVDTNYFRVIEAPEAERVSVYRNDAGSATPITTYYTKTGVDARQAAAVRLNRSLQRLGDRGQTLHSDFNLAAHGLGTPLFGGVQNALEGEELWTVERATPTYALQHTADGSLKYVEVPPGMIAREYNPETGQYQAQISGSVTNEFLWSTEFGNAVWEKGDGVTISSDAIDSVIDGSFADKIIEPTSLGVPFVNQVKNLTEGQSYCRCVIVKQDSSLRHLQLQFGSAITGSQQIAAFNLTNGETLSTPDIDALKSISLGNGWYLCYAVITPTSSVTVGIMQTRVTQSFVAVNDEYTGDGTSGIYIAHAQLVEGTSPGPITVTEGAPVTRAADNVSRQLGAEFNTNRFTVIARFSTSPPSVGPKRIFTLTGALSSFSSGLYVSVNSDSRILVEFRSGGSAIIPPVTRSIVSCINDVIAISVSASGLILAVNGATYTLYDGDIIPEVGVLLAGMSSSTSRAPFLDGGLSYLGLMPVDLTATQLQELTTL